ncbi:universal stress protein [Ornithinimicrobium sp. Arc0846-15]|nr:universal stress protein [Ornithinimicrobium laminariae]
MRPIVVGVDPEEPTSAAVDWAIGEAKLRKRPLSLVLACGIPAAPQHEYPIGMNLPLKWAEEVVAKTAEYVRAQAPQVQVDSQVEPGTPGQVLVAASAGAEVVVVGRQGLGRVESARLGSTSAQIAAHARCPVVVVSDKTDPHVDRPVVVGVDGSQANSAAIEYAFQAAQLRKVPLIAIYAWELNLSEKAILMWMGQENFDNLCRDQERVVHEAMAGWSQNYPDVEVDHVVSRQPPLARLETEARSAGLLVVGSRGRGGFARSVLGSVSQGLLYRVHECPVVIARDVE